jgi:hypothetical protein
MRKAILLALVGALAGALAVPVIAATRHEHQFSMKFSSKKAKSSSGLTFSTNRVGYKVPPPNTPADPVTKLAFTLHKGTRVNTSVVPACSKSKLESQGPSACPSGSKIGSGSATVITGIPALDPVKEKVTLFAKKGGILSYLSGAQSLVIELKASGNKLTTSVPRVCLPPGTLAQGCPNGEAVLTIFRSTIKAKKTSKGALVTTPSKCPSSHKWTNKVNYTFRNGDTEQETSSSLCRG